MSHPKNVVLIDQNVTKNLLSLIRLIFSCIYLFQYVDDEQKDSITKQKGDLHIGRGRRITRIVNNFVEFVHVLSTLIFQSLSIRNRHFDLREY